MNASIKPAPQQTHASRPPSPMPAIRLVAPGRKFEKRPTTPGKFKRTPYRTTRARISQRTSAIERSISSPKERPNRAVGVSVVGTKKEEKQNFRVRFLHTDAHNKLILFMYLPHPSWVLWQALLPACRPIEVGQIAPLRRLFSLFAASFNRRLLRPPIGGNADPENSSSCHGRGEGFALGFGLKAQRRSTWATQQTESLSTIPSNCSPCWFRGSMRAMSTA